MKQFTSVENRDPSHLFGWNSGQPVLVPAPLSPAQYDAFNEGSLLAADGGVFALSELADPVILTATGQVRSGPSEYCGFHVRAAVGFPQTVTVYDALSVTGVPIHTQVVSALGYHPWSGNKARPCSVGVYASITGGTSRTVEFL